MKNVLSFIKEKWMAFADILLFVNTRILLFFIYFIIVGPIALMMKIFGQDLLEKKIDLSQETFFKPRKENSFDIERYKRQF
ncbi:MAG: hypothetical protein HQK84_01565 [Nitrospinae bacterium]|nr:hypothetical protein [Nitrospinota bacterium]